MRGLEPWDPPSSPSQSGGPRLLYWNGLLCVCPCVCVGMCIYVFVCVLGAFQVDQW